MELLIALLIGTLFGTGIYSLLRRSVVKMVIGIILISQGANLLVLAAGGIQEGAPPLIVGGEKMLQAPYADPLPQALVLTAIVIGFGLIAFSLALVHRAYQSLGTDDINAFKQTDQLK
jgi:multicomponent Na+:H+ antiporter subunit C